MLVPFRHPVGIAVSALALLSFLGFVLASVYGEPAGVRGRDLKVERIRASSAPLVAADLAGFQERRRREGRGYASDTQSLLARPVRRRAPPPDARLDRVPRRAGKRDAHPLRHRDEERAGG
jgi:hypothetical protein